MNVAFRVDAAVHIGSGHLMRCLTLAGRLADQGASVLFICRALPDYYQQLILGKCYQLVALAEEIAPANSHLAHGSWLAASQENDAKRCVEAFNGSVFDCLIVDHYGIDAVWERLVRPSCHKLLVIDDLADRQHNCDFLLDQNFYRNSDERYTGRLNRKCKQLLGPKFALLRPEFLEKRAGLKPFSEEVKKVLVFFGGADQDNYTKLAVTALSSLNLVDIEGDVIVGASYPFCNDLKQLCDHLGFNYHCQTDKVADLMSAADLAIGAGGSATWERCCLGLPSIVISVAENQNELVAHAAVSGLVYRIDNKLLTSDKISRHLQLMFENYHLRQLIRNNGLQLVKGDGADRLSKLLIGHSLYVRKATEADCEVLFAWRNHPTIRSVSKSSQLISMDSHRCWFTCVINAPDRELLVIQNQHEPVAVVRYDLSKEEAEVSIYLVPGFEGRGLGVAVLACAENWLKQTHRQINNLRAVVLQDNYPSHQLFLNSDYQKQQTSYCKQL